MPVLIVEYALNVKYFFLIHTDRFTVQVLSRYHYAHSFDCVNLRVVAKSIENGSMSCVKNKRCNNEAC